VSSTSNSKTIGLTSSNFKSFRKRLEGLAQEFNFKNKKANKPKQQNYPLENGRKPLESVENYSKKTLSYLKPNLFNNPSTKSSHVR